MKVKTRNVGAGPQGVIPRGTVIEVGPLAGKRLIGSHQALPADRSCEVAKGRDGKPLRFHDNDKDEKQWLAELEAEEAEDVPAETVGA